MTIPKKKVLLFQKRILAWYEKNRRDLPWREIPGGTSLRKQDPYRILVSEVMLQQTQVARVIPKYEAWLKRFPTVDALANASTKDVLEAWSGLGYNRRALNLQKAAQVISKEHRGIWPREKEILKKLPGIGEYTAGAILCFVFDEQVAVVDTNIRKVILTEFFSCHCEELKMTKQSHKKDCRASLAMTAKALQGFAEQLLPEGKARDWNQALMDYSALVLKAKKVPLKKQSRFQGSNRFYRGKLLRLLLAEGSIELANVGQKLKSDFSSEENEWLLQVIRQMEKEGFVRTDRTKIYLLA